MIHVIKTLVLIRENQFHILQFIRKNIPNWRESGREINDYLIRRCRCMKAVIELLTQFSLEKEEEGRIIFSEMISEIASNILVWAAIFVRDFSIVNSLWFQFLLVLFFILITGEAISSNPFLILSHENPFWSQCNCV
jgi:hypothetical protein